MREAPFTVGDSIKEGWELTKKYLGFLLGFQIVLYVLTAIFSGGHGGWIWAPWHLIGWVIVILGKMGLYNSTLLITANITPGFDQFYRNWPLFISWVVASFLFGIMLFVGLVLLIVPGCYVLARYGLFPFFILDKDLGPIEALSEASKATEGIRWQVFLLFLACIGLNILGLLLLGVGLLFTIPVSLLALATVYRKITSPQVQANKISEF